MGDDRGAGKPREGRSGGAVRIVYQVSKVVKIPVVGIGGVATASDALEFILAGARAVQVGTALFVDPQCPYAILDGIAAYCERHGYSAVESLVGHVKDPGPRPSCHE